MKIPPDYDLSDKIIDLTTKIEANKLFLKSFDLPSQLSIKLQRKSQLKSSLFSARIEGNPLTMEDLDYSDNQLKRKEIFNILDGLELIKQKVSLGSSLSTSILLDLHQISLRDIAEDAGEFRTEMGAIFNSSGVAVYLPPPPQKIAKMLEDLLDYINSASDNLPLITSFLSHLVFEKIHPFRDGNGRVGRLLIFAILKAKNWNYPLFVPFEEYLDIHKSDYYYFLDKGTISTSDYLEFMLNGFFEQSEKVKKEALSYVENKKKIFLPPRQEEIYFVIKEHRSVSFDFIRRRFMKVPSRTLRYDLKRLADMDLIAKVGKTRGAFYTLKC